MKIASFCRLGMVAAILFTVLPLSADTQFRVRKMVRNDVPPGKGQCDIRLQVDDEVEVTLRGDLVYLRTIRGRDGRDDGSECNEPLPNHPAANFNFEVKDGRGETRFTGGWRATGITRMAAAVSATTATAAAVSMMTTAGVVSATMVTAAEGREACPGTIPIIPAVRGAAFPG